MTTGPTACTEQEDIEQQGTEQQGTEHQALNICHEAP
jgi:hypothetical protein